MLSESQKINNFSNFPQVVAKPLTELAQFCEACDAKFSSIANQSVDDSVEERDQLLRSFEYFIYNHCFDFIKGGYYQWKENSILEFNVAQNILIARLLINADRVLLDGRFRYRAIQILERIHQRYFDRQRKQLVCAERFQADESPVYYAAQILDKLSSEEADLFRNLVKQKNKEALVEHKVNNSSMLTKLDGLLSLQVCSLAQAAEFSDIAFKQSQYIYASIVNQLELVHQLPQNSHALFTSQSELSIEDFIYCVESLSSILLALDEQIDNDWLTELVFNLAQLLIEKDQPFDICLSGLAALIRYLQCFSIRTESKQVKAKPAAQELLLAIARLSEIVANQLESFQLTSVQTVEKHLSLKQRENLDLCLTVMEYLTPLSELVDPKEYQILKSIRKNLTPLKPYQILCVANDLNNHVKRQQVLSRFDHRVLIFDY